MREKVAQQTGTKTAPDMFFTTTTQLSLLVLCIPSSLLLDLLSRAFECLEGIQPSACTWETTSEIRSQ